AALFREPAIERRPRIRRQHAKDGDAGRPRANGVDRTLRHARRIRLHAEDERGNRKNVVPGELAENRLVLARLVEALVRGLETLAADRLQPDENRACAAG